MTYTRISADCHIDMPWIPPDLFTANASAAMRDRMPYVTDGPDGAHWTCKNGTSFGLVGGVGPSGQKLVPGQNYRVDNDWLVDFCRHYPDRQIGLACLPYGDIDAAVREVHRVARLGLRGLELSCSWDMEPMWHPVWEPLWQAVHEVHLPLHFHTFPSTPASVREKAPTNLAKR